ncbi:hypothetical protein BTVI_48718 [Pitangus sulphuratus]|nr:hypothetical protein BTVI_48718 [Pitangus sulphuratus]
MQSMEESTVEEVDDTRPVGVADALEGCAAFQRDFNRLRHWLQEPHEIQQREYKVLHLEKNNPVNQYMVETDWIENSQKKTQVYSWIPSST